MVSVERPFSREAGLNGNSLVNYWHFTSLSQVTRESFPEHQNKIGDFEPRAIRS